MNAGHLRRVGSRGDGAARRGIGDVVGGEDRRAGAGGVAVELEADDRPCRRADASGDARAARQRACTERDRARGGRRDRRRPLRDDRLVRSAARQRHGCVVRVTAVGDPPAVGPCRRRRERRRADGRRARSRHIGAKRLEDGHAGAREVVRPVEAEVHRRARLGELASGDRDRVGDRPGAERDLRRGVRRERRRRPVHDGARARGVAYGVIEYVVRVPAVRRCPLIGSRRCRSVGRGGDVVASSRNRDAVGIDHGGANCVVGSVEAEGHRGARLGIDAPAHDRAGGQARRTERHVRRRVHGDDRARLRDDDPLIGVVAVSGDGRVVGVAVVCRYPPVCAGLHGRVPARRHEDRSSTDGDHDGLLEDRDHARGVARPVQAKGQRRPGLRVDAPGDLDGVEQWSRAELRDGRLGFGAERRNVGGAGREGERAGRGRGTRDRHGAQQRRRHEQPVPPCVPATREQLSPQLAATAALQTAGFVFFGLRHRSTIDARFFEKIVRR